MEIEELNVIGFFILCIILCIGIPGNMISMIVWMKGEDCHKSSSAVYFKLLAVCDLTVLLLPGVDYFMYLFPWNKVDLRLTSDLACKFLTSVTFFTLELSLGVTIALTIERAVTVCFPFTTYKSNVKKRAYVIFAVIVALSLVLAAPHFLTEHVIEENVGRVNTSDFNETYKMCTYSRDSEYVKTIRTFQTIQFSCHVLVPLIIITVCNSIILRKLCQNEQQDIQTEYNTIRKTIHSVTLLIACIGITHVVSTLPMALHVISLYHNFQLTEFWTTCMRLVIQTLLFLNSGINCVLYCFIGSAFRKDCYKLWKDLINCCRKRWWQIKDENLDFNTSTSINWKLIMCCSQSNIYEDTEQPVKKSTFFHKKYSILLNLVSTIKTGFWLNIINFRKKSGKFFYLFLQPFHVIFFKCIPPRLLINCDLWLLYWSY